MHQKFHSQRNKAKATGYKRGFPDLFIYEPRNNYHGLAIELKVGYNKPTNERGYKANVCTGIEETLEIINKYLKL